MTALATQPDLRSSILQERLGRIRKRQAQLQATPQQRVEALRAQIEDRVARRSRTAGLILQNRANTPQSVTEKRKRPRLTLDDLESLSETELSQQLLAEPTDKRSGFQRFFDLIDLPRNVIANVFFRGTAAKKAGDSDAPRGTFGLPKVFFSDVLDEMGFEPGFVRSVLGFVGDVALDPLTYLGGAGGAKVALKAGQTSISKGATKALTKTIAKIAAGETVAATGRIASLQPVIKQLIRRRDAITRSLAKPGSRLAGQLAKSKLTKEQFLKQSLRQKVFGTTKVPKGFELGGLPVTTVGVLGQKVGRDTVVGRGVTAFLQKEAVRGGIQLSVPFTGIGGTLLARGPLKQLRGLTPEAVAAARGVETANISRAAGFIEEGQEQLARYNTLAAEYKTSVAKASGGAAEALETVPTRFGPRIDTGLDIVGPLGRAETQLKGQFNAILSEINVQEKGFLNAPFRAIAEVDDVALRFMADLHSPPGLNMGSSPTMIARASDLIRGPGHQPGNRKKIADGLTFVDTKLRRLFGTGVRGTLIGQPFRQTANLLEIAKREGELQRFALQGEIDKLVTRFGNNNFNREKINDYITAKLEIGMASAVDPTGQALYAAPNLALDLTNPDSIKAAREYAFGAGRANGGTRVVWDELYDTILDGLENDNLWNDPALNKMVEGLQSQYSKLNELQIKSGILEGGIENFAPRKLTRKAQIAVSRAAATRVHQTGGASEAAALSQFGFMKHRTTNRFVWTNPKTGERFSYYGFELENTAIAQRVKKAIDDKLVPKEGYQASVKHVNAQAESGGSFQTLFQGDYKGKLFDEAPEVALGSHYSQTRQAVVGKDLANYLRKDVHAVDERQITEWVQKGFLERVGAKDGFGSQGAFRVTSGSDAVLAKLADQGDIIRRLTKFDEGNPVSRHFDGIKDKFMDARIADTIEDFAAQFGDESRIEEALKLIDGANSVMKTTMLMHPSWFTFNVVGNVMATIMLGGTVKHLPLMATARQMYTKRNRLIKLAGGRESRTALGFIPVKAIASDPKALGDLERFLDETIQVGEQFLTRREIFDVADSTGILEPGRTLRGILNHGMKTGDDQRSALNKIYNNTVTRAWFGFNHNVEQSQRLFSMLVRMDIGDGAADAATKALLHHYDYGDFTKFENAFMRRLVLFYPWLRNNTPFMMQSLLREPKWAAAFPKLHEAIESTVDDQSRIAPEHRPGFFNEQLGAQFSEGQGILLPMLTPIQDLAEVGQFLFPGSGGISDFLHWATSSVSPFIQLPAELATGREFFTGRPIGDPDIGEVSPRTFLAEQFRPIREVSRFTRIFTDDRLTTGEQLERAVSRSLLAGRVQFLDPDRTIGRKTFELSETAKALRNRLNRFTDADGKITEGNTAEATRINVRLFNTWKEIFAIDPDSAFIPKRIRDLFAAQQPTPGSP